MNAKDLQKTTNDFYKQVSEQNYRGKLTVMMLVTDGDRMSITVDGYSTHISNALTEAMMEDRVIAQGICSATARYYKLKKQQNNGTEDK